MSWNFAIVNGRLAEIYWDEKSKTPKVWAHCYVKKSEFKTKGEQRDIKEDTARYRFSWRNKKYRRLPVI